jgi:hypothetical protein
MTKRNITLMGIVLILLIAIGLTIALGGGKVGMVSLGTLHSHTLGREPLGLQQADLDLRLLDPAPVRLDATLNSGLAGGLDKTGLKLDNNLNDGSNTSVDTLTPVSLTAGAGGLALQLDLAALSKRGAPLAVLGNGLKTNLLSA